MLGRRAASRRYTYGYDRAEDLAGVFIVAMIALTAVLAGHESVRKLLDPQPVSHVGIVLAAGVVGFLGNELPGVVGVDEVRLRWTGHRMRAEAGVTVDASLGVVEAHDIATAAHHALPHGVPRLVTATVHVGPHGHRHEALAHHAAVTRG